MRWLLLALVGALCVSCGTELETVDPVSEDSAMGLVGMLGTTATLTAAPNTTAVVELARVRSVVDGTETPMSRMMTIVLQDLTYQNSLQVLDVNQTSVLPLGAFLSARIEFGAGGTLGVGASIDFTHGTAFSVPGSACAVTAQLENFTGAPISRKVGAFISLDTTDSENAPVRTVPLIGIPQAFPIGLHPLPFATDAKLLMGELASVATMEFLAMGGGVIGTFNNAAGAVMDWVTLPAHTQIIRVTRTGGPVLGNVILVQRMNF